METTAENDPYRVLRLARAATPDEVRDAYRRRAFESHPDRAGGSASEFLAVAAAYRLLSDPLRRSEYDAAHPPATSLATVARPEASPPDDELPWAEADVAEVVAEVAVPVAEAARSLFEYLTDVARRMILAGSAPADVIASLRAEGCPESVASALERDLRAELRPAPRVARRGRRHVRVAAGCAFALAAAAAVAMVRPARDEAVAEPAVRATASAPPATPAPAATSAPTPAAAAAAAAPERPRPAARVKGAPSTPSAPARREPRLTLAETSAALDAEKADLERGWRALDAESAALQEERTRIDAAAAALGEGAAPADAAAVRRAQAAYNARLEAARGRERALQRRTAELNARLQAYNARVVAARQSRR